MFVVNICGSDVVIIIETASRKCRSPVSLHWPKFLYNEKGLFGLLMYFLCLMLPQLDCMACQDTLLRWSDCQTVTGELHKITTIKIYKKLLIFLFKYIIKRIWKACRKCKRRHCQGSLLRLPYDLRHEVGTVLPRVLCHVITCFHDVTGLDVPTNQSLAWQRYHH